jgi:hypothetical protein
LGNFNFDVKATNRFNENVNEARLFLSSPYRAGENASEVMSIIKSDTRSIGSRPFLTMDLQDVLGTDMNVRKLETGTGKYKFYIYWNVDETNEVVYLLALLRKGYTYYE